MLNLVSYCCIFSSIQSIKKLRPFGAKHSIYGCVHFSSMSNQNPHPSSSPLSNVGIFWDLDNKPPKSVPPHEAAIKLKQAAQRFGFVKYMIACANCHSFSYVPSSVRGERRERKALDNLETTGFIKPNVPYVCRVCGRKFYNNERLVNHFKQIHEREHIKRMNQIESARGNMRVKLVGKYSMKMDKYRKAARDVLTPKVGYGLGDELKRAGFFVREVSDKPQAADVALRNHMVDMMDKRKIECVVLVSDDSDFVEILKEARLRCLKTVVVGNDAESALKRTADASFSWAEIMRGKAKSEAVSVLGRWKDQNVLQRLEWSYDPETDGKHDCSELESGDSDFEFCSPDEGGTLLGKENDSEWWELGSKAIDVNRNSVLK